MKKTIKKCIAFLLCLHTVLFVVFQVSSVVMAASDSYGQFVTSSEAEREEVVTETLESEDAEESAEETLESEESKESAEDASEETLESEESKESTEEILESEESKESTEETLEGEETEASSRETVDESQESQEVEEETLEESENSSDISEIDEEETENEDETQEGATLEWMSYADYRAEEALKAWNNPGLYVGQTAIFNQNWGYIFLKSEDELQVVDDDNTEGATVEYWECCDDNGQSIKVVITDYIKTSETDLWYKIEAAEGYELPETLVGNPYVLYTNLGEEEYEPTLLMLPLQGMFVGETVYVQKEKVAASKGDVINVADVPEFFDVVWTLEELDENAAEGTIPLEFYDLGDVSDWAGITGPDYRYVSANSVILIPAEVSRAYEELLNAKDADEYNEIMSQLPESITSQFTDKHLANLEEHFEEISVIEPIEYATTVTIGGKEVEVAVYGRIPHEGVTLSVTEVASETVISEGFDIKDATDIVTALDIKIINDEDGTEWQPDSDEMISVSIDMAALGYEDGRIFRFHHKHDEEITVYEIFVVMGGKLTLGTTGFSLYVISDDVFNENDPSYTGNDISVDSAGGTIPSLAVGETKVYYVQRRNNAGEPNLTEDANNITSAWHVNDPEGAIYYEIYTTRETRSYGSDGRWIKVTALKETTTPITLTYYYTDNINTTQWQDPNNFQNQNMHEQTFTLSVVTPKATGTNSKRIYLRDEVNTSGCIVATLVDQNGNVIDGGLEGAAFSWTRMDGEKEMFIMPDAYENLDEGDVSTDPNRVDNDRINIAKDHGGLLEAKSKIENGKKVYVPTVYTVEVTLADGTVLEDDYTVYYQSEIINSGFEAPDAGHQSYTFFANGWPGMYWKTTGVGTGGNLSRDVEYVDFTGGQNGTNPGFGVSGAAEGVQFAELNAEAFGTLYQDIITAPEEEVVWSFSHAQRPEQSTRPTPNYSDNMYIVMGPTEGAQKLTTQAHLDALAQVARNADTTNALNNGGSVTVRFNETTMKADENGSQYTLWYHEARTTGVWETIEGFYIAPENQYRTRVFFMSRSRTNNTNPNYGNLIDAAKVGQYKDYLIEYYEETFDENGNSVITHIVNRNESGTALVYSTVPLANLDNYFLKQEHDYLNEILINGKRYPYNIRFAGDTPSIYIDKYEGTADESRSLTQETTGKSYEDYDIVVQIFLRDTVIAVQKKIVFPDELTSEQKYKIIQDLNDSEDGKGSYKAKFALFDVDPGHNYRAEGVIPITHRDPMDQYTGYLSLGENPSLGHKYVVEEEKPMSLVGLELASVSFKTTLYAYDDVGNFSSSVSAVGYTEVQITELNVPIRSLEIDLRQGQQIAEVVVENVYKEKEITISYEAVGNGKVAFIGDTILDFKDTPTETIKFYSEKAQGAGIHPGNGASFDGWYKDAACTEKVTDVDGFWDKDTNSFRPNANIINEEEITFYAKFVTGSIEINRTNAEPGQIFVYHIQSTGTDVTPVDMYVTVQCDENGNGSTEIFEVPKANYVVTELSEWSWRYNTVVSDSKPAGEGKVTFDFNGSMRADKIYWLNGFGEIAKNVFKVVQKITGGS